MNEEILSISAAGRYLAVLYMDSVVIYTEELEIYAQLEGTDYARSVLMRRMALPCCWRQRAPTCSCLEWETLILEFTKRLRAKR